MNIEHSIALLTCWYGKYPWYFPYFIKSCSYNPTIDFIIITDNTEPIPYKPSNVIIIYKTLHELKAEASAKLGFDLNFTEPYKLCDLKPAFGFFFEKILEKYHFWGHGDIDMVYGNIREFISSDVLNEYDIINASKNFITGTFCLYRNNDFIKTLFMESRDYKKVFTESNYLGFDECSFLFYELHKPGVTIFDFPEHLQSMTYIVRAAEAEGRLKPLFEFYLFQMMTNRIRWDNGAIIYANKMECLFYDLIKYKKFCKQKTTSYPIPDVFYFNKRGVNKNSFLKLFFLRIAAKLNS
ncbi:DUF6625 family protein [Flavobacterium sp. KBS0721]|uniref:DUF6625 family protein n=1 Tax=Flavobacterium sp. KBS0721 TaxID=1179672 RepID=UPI0009C5BAC0|nr:DUF6625 family protein [Flavobacterium sp. KBS0721]QDW21027.1 hypothetical protein B0M43_0013175 [Flavobacterium sp. KBS0721]